MDGKCKKEVFEMSKKKKKWFFDIWLNKEVISNCLLSLNGKGKMINPLTLRSDWYLFSPNITAESNTEDMRIREVIIKTKSSWLLKKKTHLLLVNTT